MKRLLCTVGLPQSGKSSWAKLQACPIVCPDAIRLAMHARAYFAPMEPWTWAMAYTMTEALFQAGHETVIFDATNTTRKRRDALRLQGDTFGEHPNMLGWSCTFVLFQTSRSVCIERATRTGRLDLIPVIERMAEVFEPLGSDEAVMLGEP